MDKNGNPFPSEWERFVGECPECLQSNGQHGISCGRAPKDFARKWELWKAEPKKLNYWDSDTLKQWHAPSFDEAIKFGFQQTEKRRYEKLDWCILYALGIGIEQSRLSLDHTTENWMLVASDWKDYSRVVLVTIRTSLSGQTVAEFSDEFAAELCDQAYGDPKITTVYTTEDDERILS